MNRIVPYKQSREDSLDCIYIYLHTYTYESKNNLISQPSKKKIKQFCNKTPCITINAKKTKTKKLLNKMLAKCFKCIKRKIVSNQVGHFQNARKCVNIIYL